MRLFGHGLFSLTTCCVLLCFGFGFRFGCARLLNVLGSFCGLLPVLGNFLFFLQTIFNGPVFILKKELIKIPIFGNYLKKIGAISIERNKTTKENLGFIEKIFKISTDTDRPVLIFPQGTRTKPGEFVQFKKGVGRIYDELNIKCQPIAINSGNVWPKNGQLKANKTITVSILPSINEGLEKNIFLDLLEKEIYNELNKLN